MHCPGCGKSLLVNETTCTRCGRVVLLANPVDSVPWEPWRRWVPLIGVVLFVAAAFVVILAMKPFLASGKNDRIEVALPTLPPLRTTPPSGPGGSAAPASVGTGTTPATAAGGSVVPPTATTAPSSTVDPTANTLPSLGSTLPPGTTAPVTTAVTGSTVPSSSIALVPAAPLHVDGAQAACTAEPSTDSRGNLATFDAANVIDGRDSTAWRCAGDATGQSLIFTFASPVQLTSVGAEPGYNRIDQYNGDDRWTQNRRVTSATWTCITPSGAAAGTISQTFQDARQVQATSVTSGFDSCSSLRFTITGVSAAGSRDFTAISEVSVSGRPAA